jgi:cytochrome P450
VAFGWAGHFCFGAPLARLEGQIAFETLLRRTPDLELEPGPPTWQDNLCYRGLVALPITYPIAPQADDGSGVASRGG